MQMQSGRTLPLKRCQKDVKIGRFSVPSNTGEGADTAEQTAQPWEQQLHENRQTLVKYGGRSPKYNLGSMSRDVHRCTHWRRPRNSPPTPAFGLVDECAIGLQR
jgi:hypothetical protein